MVPFQSSNQFALIRAAATAADESNRLRVIVVHGDGGAGKTRLVAELCSQLRSAGWATGFATDEDTFDYLASISSPLLVAVDYADFRRRDTVRQLFKKLAAHASDSSRCIVLIGRSAGVWWDELASDVADLGIVIDATVLEPLTSTASFFGSVWNAALRSLALVHGVTAPAIQRPSGRWTPLESVLLAWIAVFTDGPMPTTADQLYKETLRHGYGYWHQGLRATTTAIERVDRDVTGGILTLVAPATRVDAIALIKAHRPEVASVAEVIVKRFADLWAPTWQLTDGFPDCLALRPDRLGDSFIRSLLERRTAIEVLVGVAGHRDAAPADGIDGLHRVIENLMRSASDRNADPRIYAEAFAEAGRRSAIVARELPLVAAAGFAPAASALAAGLSALGDLHPDTTLAAVVAMVADQTDGEFVQMLATLDRQAAIDAALSGWIATPTWSASEESRSKLAETAQNQDVHERQRMISAQHFAILQCIEHIGAGRTFGAVGDPLRASNEANQALRRGETEVLRLLLSVAPSLIEIPIGLVGVGVLAIQAGEEPSDELIRAIGAVLASDEAAVTTRKAIKMYLKELSGLRPEWADKVKALYLRCKRAGVRLARCGGVTIDRIERPAQLFERPDKAIAIERVSRRYRWTTPVRYCRPRAV